MTTVSGQRASVENVAASGPIRGQGAASEITATTPLPTGWGSFCSNPDRDNHARWYAVAPWHVDTVKMTVSDWNRDLARKLVQTVDAATWPALYAAVAEQTALYTSVMEGEGE